MLPGPADAGSRGCPPSSATRWSVHPLFTGHHVTQHGMRSGRTGRHRRRWLARDDIVQGRDGAGWTRFRHRTRARNGPARGICRLGRLCRRRWRRLGRGRGRQWGGNVNRWNPGGLGREGDGEALLPGGGALRNWGRRVLCDRATEHDEDEDPAYLPAPHHGFLDGRRADRRRSRKLGSGRTPGWRNPAVGVAADRGQPLLMILASTRSPWHVEDVRAWAGHCLNDG